MRLQFLFFLFCHPHMRTTLATPANYITFESNLVECVSILTTKTFTDKMIQLWNDPFKVIVILKLKKFSPQHRPSFLFFLILKMNKNYNQKERKETFFQTRQSSPLYHIHSPQSTRATHPTLLSTFLILSKSSKSKIE